MRTLRSRLVFAAFLIGVLASLLALPAASAQPTTDTAFLRTFLTGDQEAPGPGDPDGFGIAGVRVNATTGEICYLAVGVGIEPATAAHIHVAPVGEPGPVVLPLTQVNAHVFRGCATDMLLAAALLVDPSAYYVNIHNATYPAGAIRGQLG